MKKLWFVFVGFYMFLQPDKGTIKSFLSKHSREGPKLLVLRQVKVNRKCYFEI